MIDKQNDYEKLEQYMKRGNLTVAGLLKYQESKMPKV